ncbi:flagellar hook-basal body complex protein [Sphingomonas pokkalii]|uniref:Flagellar biosynthesis protein FlgF n=1 Tax=Sphingomonas pokkalii TaxID=2175090 RepID=A0A2U0SFY0_9SPHN|nr:flagellar hook-basal body complex protein [Sphingomonas pokkalii]PVX30273.1 flagellar biosynthesis protein FlgF [Sphingomonas pokkalii]
MDISSYVLLSQEQALRRRLDIVSNNIANMNTVGFKREQPVFREYVEQTDSAVKPAKQTSFVLDYGAVHDVSNGAFQPTGNPLDVMIDGPGYLAVQAGDGSTAYTRAGFVKVLESGELATAGGQMILGAGGKPIKVPPEETGKLSVTADGSVMGSNGPLGRIAVTVFDNEGVVDPRGDGMFTASGGRELAANETKLVSGGVEGSNVNAIVETTDMIQILRAYQTSQSLSNSMSDMRKNAIDKLGRVG